MKQFAALLLTVALVMSLAACGGFTRPAATEATTVATEAATQPTEAPTEATEATTQPTEAPRKPTEAPTKPTEPVKVNPPFITKNPTSESVTEGDNAYFVAKAEDYDYITWFIVSPDHKYQYSTTEAPRYFKGLSIAGETSTQLILCNCPLSLDGWCVEAMFTGPGGRAVTDHCYVNVKQAARTQLWASPSSGYFYFTEQAIQLNADKNDTIYYELHTFEGIESGTVKSGDRVYLPMLAGDVYDAYLYAYVTTDKSNAISCRYTIDCYEAPAPTPVPAPTVPDSYLDGDYRNSDGDTVSLSSNSNGDVFCTIGISGLSTFHGTGYYNGGIAFLVLEDPNGGRIDATFDGHALTIYQSEWNLLDPGTFYGF